MDMLFIGSVGIDSLKTPSGEASLVPGGSAVHAGTAASHFAKPHICGVVGDDYPQQFRDDFINKGLDLTGLETVPGKTFFWSGEYHNLNQAKSLATELGVFACFNPQLPVHQAAMPVVFLGNIDPVLQLNVLDQATGARLTAADTMNFWISGNKDAVLKVLARVDVQFINEDELRDLSGLHNVYEAARWALALGPRFIVVKRGEYGSLLVGKDVLFFCPVYPVTKVVDPTGAGDSFAGGFLGWLAEHGLDNENEFKKAMVAGTACASFNIQEFSVYGLLRANRAQIDERMAYIESITRL